MVDLAPFIYLSLIVVLAEGLVVATICLLVGRYFYRKFSDRSREPISTQVSEGQKLPQIRTPLDIPPQPQNA